MNNQGKDVNTRYNRFQADVQLSNSDFYEKLFPKNKESKIINNPHIFVMEAFYRSMKKEGIHKKMGVANMIDYMYGLYVWTFEKEMMEVEWKNGELMFKGDKEELQDFMQGFEPQGDK